MPWSDHSEQPIRLIESATDQKAKEVVPASAIGATRVPEAPPTQDDEELVDYEASPEHSNMEINVVHFSEEYLAISEEETTHLDFGLLKCSLAWPKESNNHLKSL